MGTIGLTRTARAEEDRKPWVDRYIRMDGLTELLQSSDYVVNVLPSTPGSVGLLSGEVLRSCSAEAGGKRATFVNVGRGDVISEESLLRALREGWISGALLDVFAVEPLPKSSELWDLPGVVVSP